MVSQDFELWSTNLILYCHNLQGIIHILHFTGIRLYWLFADTWVINWRSKIFLWYSEDLYYELPLLRFHLSKIWRVEKAIKNYEESRIQHFTLSLFSESLRLGYLNYKSLPATLWMEGDGLFSTSSCLKSTVLITGNFNRNWGQEHCREVARPLGSFYKVPVSDPWLSYFSECGQFHHRNKNFK